MRRRRNGWAWLAVAAAALAGGTQAGSSIHADNTGVGTKVKLSGSTYTIDDGALVGTNLFESFADFSLAVGATAKWTYSPGDPASITNVINRVTGGSVSQIDGTLDSTALCNAAFYFINPAGIVFGKGASVNVPGAAYFSTASELRFADGASFSAATPAGSTLTMAAPTAFGFLGGEGDMTLYGLDATFLPQAGALSLSAANLTISNSSFNPGGLDLIAVGGQGLGLTLSNPLATRRLSGSLAIDLSDLTTLPASGANGAINIGGGAVTVTGGAVQTEASSVAQGGAMGIEAQTLTLDAGASVRSLTNTGQAAGDVAVNATIALAVQNGSSLSSETRGAGNAGDVNVTAAGLLVDGGAGKSGSTFISSDTRSSGKAGQVRVNVAGKLVVQNGGSISAETHSLGDSGDVLVHAESLLIDGGASESAGISSSSFGFGNAGAVAVFVSGIMTIQNGGSVSSEADATVGAAGEVTVSAGSLSVDGPFASISSNTFSSANGGQVNVTVARNLMVQNGGSISADTLGVGNAGNVTVSASSLLIDGGMSAAGTTYIASDFASDNAGDIGTGNAGRIALTVTGKMSIQNGGLVSSEARDSVGAAGDVTVSAGSLFIDGGDKGAGFTLISSDTYSSENGGQVKVNVAGKLVVQNGGSISADTLGLGNAGDVNVRAESLVIDAGAPDATSTYISSNAFSSGNAGQVNVAAGNLIVQDGGLIESATVGSGNAGDVTVAAGNLSIQDGGFINADTFGLGNAGDVTVSAGSLLIDGGAAGKASISSSSATDTLKQIGRGNAGAVIVRVSGNLVIRKDGAVSSEADDSVGAAGEVIVRAGSLLIDGGLSFISSNTHGSGAGGQVNVNVTDGLTVQNGGSISAETLGAGAAGDVNVTAGSLLVDDGGITSASTVDTTSGEAGTGNAGAVAVTVGRNLTVQDGGSISSDATGSKGAAGDVTVTAADLVVQTGANGPGSVSTNSANINPAGQITITANDILVGGAGSQISSANSSTPSPGAAGAISITTGAISLSNGGLVTTSSKSGPAGDISFTFPDGGDLVLEGPSQSKITTSSGPESGGTISVSGATAVILEGGLIQAIGPGNAAKVNIGDIPIIQSSDALNQIAVQGALLDSGLVDVGKSVTLSSATFDDPSKVLRGQCPALQARGETSQLGTKLDGPYGPVSEIGLEGTPIAGLAASPGQCGSAQR